MLSYADTADAALAALPPGAAGRPVVGTDVQAVAPVLESLRGPLRGAYLARLFTAAEVADVGSGETTGHEIAVAESLAARFAVKEAVVKVLAPAADVPRPAWTDIEVRRRPSGAPELHLYGHAARLARTAGLAAWSCSFAHDGGLAVATVLALQSPVREVEHD